MPENRKGPFSILRHCRRKGPFHLLLCAAPNIAIFYCNLAKKQTLLGEFSADTLLDNEFGQ